MFWKSVITGLAAFGHWQVWVAVIFYMAVNSVFLVIVAKIAGEGKSGSRMAAGCFSYAIGGIVLHGMLMSLLVAFLFPILLGNPSAAPISEIIASLGTIIVIGIVATGAVMILSFVPLISNFVDCIPGVEVFLEGFIIFRLLCRLSLDQVLAKANIQGSVYPGFWSVLGFLIIAGVIAGLLMLGLGLLSALLKDAVIQELVLMIIAPMIGVLGGIVALFMYGSYVQLSTIQLIMGG